MGAIESSMISVKRIFAFDAFEPIELSSYDLVFHGDTVDERTKIISSKIAKQCTPAASHTIKWSQDTQSIEIEGVSFSSAEIKNKFSSASPVSILFDATSLDFPELVYLFDCFKGYDIDILYLEPAEYLKKQSDIGEYNFDLTSKQSRFTGLRNFTVHTGGTAVSLVAPLGFEPMRLGQLLNTDESKQYHSISGMVGVPAYKPGWENRSIKSNLRHFVSSQSPELLIYPSTNLYQIYKQIEDISAAYPKLLLAPLGTKPSTVAIAMFIVNKFSSNSRHNFVGAVYDFPIKTSGRSKGIGKAYIYKTSYC